MQRTIAPAKGLFMPLHVVHLLPKDFRSAYLEPERVMRLSSLALALSRLATYLREMAIPKIRAGIDAKQPTVELMLAGKPRVVTCREKAITSAEAFLRKAMRWVLDITAALKAAMDCPLNA